MLKISQFFDHFNFGNMSPVTGRDIGGLIFGQKISGCNIDLLWATRLFCVRLTPFLVVVVLHPSHMMDLFLDRRTGESLAVTSLSSYPPFWWGY